MSDRMEDRTCDVLVVGAGPGGSVTAKWAALGGAKVLMIEKRPEIGSPVRCGEGIARSWIEGVGIELDRRWVAHEVEGARIISPNGYEFCINERVAGNEVGTVIERDLFDRALAADAVKAGADVLVRTEATSLIKLDGKVVGVNAKHFGEPLEIRAKLVVGADGFESQIGRWGGIDTNLKPTDVTTCLQYRLTNIDIDATYCHFYIDAAVSGGYVWIFPKGPHTANVGIGMQLSRLEKAGDIKRHLDHFIERHPELAKGQALDIVGGGVSVCPPPDSVTMDGLMLVGDAARVVDPMTGGGIANACIMGKIAGEWAAKAVTAGDASAEFLKGFEKAWRDELEEQLFRNWMAKEKLLTLAPETMDKVVEVLHDADLRKLSINTVLAALQERYPEVVEEFAGLI